MAPIVYERSYGIVPLLRQTGDWQVLLVQHGSAGFWGFPKGHAERGETPQQAAFRELQEETNLTVVHLLSEKIIEEHYQFTSLGKRVHKTVWFFVAEVQGEVRIESEEIRASRWVPLNKACQHLTYAASQSTCQRAIALVNAVDARD